MVKTEKHIYGIYPKTEHLRIRINRWERGKIEVKEISSILKDEKATYFSLLKDNRIDSFTDPLFNWYDILRPVVLLSGGKLGPLTRYKETNTFYRLPEFDSVKELAFDPTEFREVEDNPPFPLYQSSDSNGFSAFLPSPVTLRKLSQVAEGTKKEDFQSAIARNYLEICKKFGVERVTLFESFEYNGDDLSFLDALSEKVKVTLITEGELKEPPLKTFKKKVYSIVSGDADNVRKASEYSEVPGLKVIDAHNTKLEDPKELKKRIGEASSAAGTDRLLVTNSDYMDFLPRGIADKKIELLSRAGE